jgi:peptidoglycan/xylan/chitin deacetylase (PgdA/CDA1 family)
LILNPQLKTVLPNGQPANWNQGSFGNNSAQFIYPFNSVVGSTSAEILFASSTTGTTSPLSGDAKWYFDNVTVLPDSSYLFSDSYESNVSTQLVAAFTLSGTTTPTYQTLTTLPPTNGVKGNSSQQITVPVGAISVTVYHLISSVGHLTVGNFSLSIHPNINIFSAGAVSLTFDDGWASQYDNALPILNTNGQKATFFPISQVASGTFETNLVNNGSMEIDGGNGAALVWNKASSGSSTVQFTYPAIGTDPIAGGNVGKASQVSVSNYISGDAKWYFNDVSVASGTVYRFRDNYKSTAASTITVRFTVASSTNPAATSTQFKIYPVLPSTNNSWQTAEDLFTTPLGVISITVFHSLNSNGDLTIDNASVSEYLDYTTKQQMLAFQAAGNEIGDHTKTHPSLIALSVASATDEIVGAKNDLLALGVNQVNTIAYPYGDHNATIDGIAKSAGLIAGRGVENGYNDKATDKFSLFTQSMTSSTPFTVVKSWIDTAVQQKVWLIIVFHQIDTLGETYSTTPTILQQISDYLKTNNILTARMEDMIPLMNP